MQTANVPGEAVCTGRVGDWGAKPPAAGGGRREPASCTFPAMRASGVRAAGDQEGPAPEIARFVGTVGTSDAAQLHLGVLHGNFPKSLEMN